MWIEEIYVIPAAFVGTVIFAIGIATGIVFNNKHHGRMPDWLNVCATMLGCIAVQAATAILLYLILK